MDSLRVEKRTRRMKNPEIGVLIWEWRMAVEAKRCHVLEVHFNLVRVFGCSRERISIQMSSPMSGSSFGARFLASATVQKSIRKGGRGIEYHETDRERERERRKPRRRDSEIGFAMER